MSTRPWGSVITDKCRDGFIARYSDPVLPGHKIQKRFHNKLDAQAWLAAERQLVEASKAGLATWTPPAERERERKEQQAKQSCPTLARYAEMKLNNFRKEDGGKPAEAYLRKLREYHRHLSTAPFWDIQLDHITPEMVTAWKNNNTLLPTPRLRAWQELKKLMKQAVEEGLIPASPLRGQSPKLPPSRQAQIPTATAEELKAIYDHMPEYSRIGLYIASVFDCRISEVCALQVRDVDLKNGLLHIRHSLGRGEGDKGYVRLKGTKTISSAQNQPIPDEMRPLLETQIAGKEPDSPLIVSPQTGRFLTDKALRHQFEQARGYAQRPDLHFHTLRKTAISAAAASGATLAETMRYGRHSDVKTSVSRYQDAGGEQRQREIANAVAARLLPQRRTAEDVRRELAEARKRVQQLQQELKRMEQPKELAKKLGETVPVD